MPAISARNRTRARGGLPVLVALVLLTGCLVPPLPVQDSTPAVDAVTQTPEPPTATLNPPAPTAADSATPSPSADRPTRTALPPWDTPLVYDCPSLDLPRADLNQLVANANAELERRMNGPLLLEATFAPLIRELTALPPGAPTPTVDPTLIYEVQEFYARNNQEIHDQPCTLTGLWPSPNGAWIAARIGSNPSHESSPYVSLYFEISRAWLVVYDTETLRPAWVADYPQGLLTVKWAPSGQQLAVLDGSRVLQVRAADGGITAAIPAPEPYSPTDRCQWGLEVGLAEQNYTWTPDEQKILRKAPGKIETWDAVTGALLSEVPFDDATAGQDAGAHKGNDKEFFCYVDVAWSPDARFLVTNDWYNSAQRPAQVWDAQTGAPVFRLKNHGTHLMWSSTNLIYQEFHEDLQIMDGQTGRPLDRQFLMGAAGAEGLWSPDGSKIAYFYYRRLTVYDVSSKTLSFFDRAANDFLSQVVWLADNIHLLVLDQGNFAPQQLFLCDTRTGELTGPGLPVPLP